MLNNTGYAHDGASVQVAVAKNGFLGGNIVIGSMLVVDDYINCLKEWLADNTAPELILIPETPFGARGSSGWRRDILGNNYKYIERAVGISVKLMPFTYYVPF